MQQKEKTKEIWKDVPGYEGYYQASNLGRVRSLDRWVTRIDGRKIFYKGFIIKGSMNNKGYMRTTLRKSGKNKTLSFSQIVAMTFLNHNPEGLKIVVDHINGDRSDDRLENLRIVTFRENTSTCFRSHKKPFSSKYVGVSIIPDTDNWVSKIQYKGVNVRIGLFKNEVEASNAYQLALSKIKDGTFNPDDYKPKWTSKHKGIYFCKRDKRWIVGTEMGGKYKSIGRFSTEEEAYNALESYKREHYSI